MKFEHNVKCRIEIAALFGHFVNKELCDDVRWDVKMLVMTFKIYFSMRRVCKNTAAFNAISKESWTT